MKFNAWKRNNEDVRVYVNCWEEAIGLEVDYYNSGNIKRATLDGEKISNSAARRILSGKVWFDQEGELHLDYHCFKDMEEEEKRARLLKALKGDKDSPLYEE